MSSISSLQQCQPHGLRTSDSALSQSLRKMGETVGAMRQSMVQGSELIQRRVDNLSQATTQMASDFIGQLAQQMFGDQAKGMTIEFDEMSLSAESSFTAMQQSSQSAQGSSQASAFRLSDSSSFSGKGTLTTADGQRFDIEIEIRYESVIEGASIAQQTNSNNTQQAIPADANTQKTPLNLDLSTLLAGLNSDSSDDDAGAAESRSSDSSRKTRSAPAELNQHFAGTAVDLLQRLTSEPMFRPFALLTPAENGQSGLKLLGDMSLQLMNLPGGPRHIDLSPDHDPSKKALDEQA